MTRLEKNKAVRIYGILIKIGFGLVISMLSFFISIGFAINYKSDFFAYLSVTLLAITIILCFIYLFFIFPYESKIKTYRKDLKEKREVNNFVRAINSLKSGDFENVRYIINYCLKDEVRRSFLNGLYRGYVMNSNDNDLKKTTEEFLDQFKIQ